MVDPTKIFAINTYSYTFDWTAADCLRHLADQGYPAVEQMMFPGHLWPDATEARKRQIRRVSEDRGIRIVSINMSNIDLNIAGAAAEMRAYSLGLIEGFTRLAGEIGAPAVVIGPGKANPLFPLPQETLVGHFYRALDRLAPLAAAAGTKLLVENMPFAFLPDAASLLACVEAYGNPNIGIVYDVANGHFVGEDPCAALRLLKARLDLVHLSDTGRSVYRHDPIGLGDVDFAPIPAILAEIGYAALPVLEVVSRDPDADTAESARRLAALGYR